MAKKTSGRIFKISKSSVSGYKLVRAPRRGKAKRNPGVTMLMGITNPAPSVRETERTRAAHRAVSVAKKAPFARRIKAYAAPRKRPRGMRAESVGRPRPITKIRPVARRSLVQGVWCETHAPKRHRREGAVSRSDYAFPQCYRYPVRTRGKASKTKIRRALSRYGQNRAGYGREARKEIEHGIARAAKAAGVRSPKAMEYRKKFGIANPKEREAMKHKKARKASKTKKKVAHGFRLFPSGKSGIIARAVANRRKAKKATKHRKSASKARWQRIGMMGRTSLMQRASLTGRRRKARVRAVELTNVKSATVKRSKGRSRMGIVARNSPLMIAAANRRRRTRRNDPGVSAHTHKVAQMLLRGRARANMAEAGEAFEEMLMAQEDLRAASRERDESVKREADEKAAAIAAAQGMARGAFSSTEDFNKWFAAMWRRADFRKYYNAHQRALAKGKGGKMRRKTTKGARKTKSGSRPRKHAARKTRKHAKATRHASKSHKSGRKAGRRAGRRDSKGRFLSKGRRKAPKRHRKASKSHRKARKHARHNAPRHGVRHPFLARVHHNDPGALTITHANRKRRHHSYRRHSGIGFRAIPNAILDRVKALLAPGLGGIGGFAVHRLATNMVVKGIGPALGAQAKYAEPLAGLAVAVGEYYIASKVGMLQRVELPITIGAIISYAMMLVRDFFPDIAPRIGLGAVSSTRPVYRLGAMGQPWKEAAAGVGEYFPASGIGEYVSDGSLVPVSDFGEYVARNLDVRGYGDYEVSQQYDVGADGYGALDDGIRPDANLDREFNLMEAKAGVGAFVEAAAGLGAARRMGHHGMGATSPVKVSNYIPHSGASLVRTQESSESSGLFDIGGGNGVLG